LPPVPELPLVLLGFAVEFDVPAPAVVVEAPPVEPAVAVPLAAPDDEFAVLLFEPLPPLPAQIPIVISLSALLVCVSEFMFAAMLLPLLVAVALLVPLVAPSLGFAAGLLLFVFVLLVPDTPAAARLHSASAKPTNIAETIVLPFKIPSSI